MTHVRVVGRDDSFLGGLGNDYLQGNEGNET